MLCVVLAHAQRIDTAFAIPDKEFLPEGITYSRELQKFFIGSFFKKKIVSVNKQGVVAEFVPAGKYDVKAFCGLTIDNQNHKLWAICVDPQPHGEDWTTGLLSFDIRSGELLERFVVNDNRSGFNDLAIFHDGRIFITDSRGGTIWVKAINASELTMILPRNTFEFPNGICVVNEVLIVADDHGLWKVDPELKSAKPLAVSPRLTLGGIDGLVANGGALIAVQNGINPKRIIRITVNQRVDSVTSVGVLDSHDTTRDHFSPTTGITDEAGCYFYLNNAQLGSIGPDGRLKDPSNLKPCIVKKTCIR